MKTVHEAVRSELEARRGTPNAAGALATASNTMVHGRAGEVRTVSSITGGVTGSLQQLRDEPFVARVVAKNEDGERRTYYFARGMPPKRAALSTLDGDLASYGTALGRLAERSPGEELTLPIKNIETTLTVIERVRLRPAHSVKGWDGRQDQIERDDGLVVTLDSLLKFLDQPVPPGQVEDLLAAIEAEAEEASLVTEGLKRVVRERMALRDMPILDQFQGEVFRLPVARRLMLSGPPGTGKTTTLIKRIAQKTRHDEATEEDKDLAGDAGEQLFHSANWVMYTPTELLRLYLQEAFAGEGVAAPNDRVRTWDADRRRLARDVLSILKSGSRKGFTLDDSAQLLLDASSTGHMRLFEAFDRTFRDEVCLNYAIRLEDLGAIEASDLRTLIDRIRRAVGGADVDFDKLFALVDFQSDLARHERDLKVDTDQRVRDLLNGMLSREPGLVNDLAILLTKSEPDDEEDEDDEADEPAPVAPVGRVGRRTAVTALRRAVEASAKEASDGGVRTRTGRNRKVLDWLGDRLMTDEAFETLGKKLVILENVRFLNNVHRNLLDQVRVEYGKFRTASAKASLWFRPEARGAIDAGKVSGAEVDVMLLATLRNARRFLARGGGRDLAPGVTLPIAVLNSIKGEYVTQVLIDEVTDFSPVQIACMLELAWPKLRSLFVCGDIRQRVTPWGVRSFADLQWVSPDFEERKISTGYRQTSRLASLAGAIGEISGELSVHVRQPDHVQEANVAPLLAEDVGGARLAAWLNNRIGEVEQAVGKVPSIAIFVDGDEQIDPLLGHLRPMLEKRNVEVVGCKEGRVVGAEGQVRIFDVQHIKGLEFEAVFFVGVDGLAKRVPDLFDKFLYVGTTRASTYLGVTCEGRLPARLEALRPLLSTGDWAGRAP
jgi:superfamily I DNA/RNA helicase